jgi:hypothetical protein
MIKHNTPPGVDVREFNVYRNTFRHIHRGTKITSSYINPNISASRTYRTKALTGGLPVQSSMRQRYPWIYPDGQCRLCGQNEETNEHIWECNSSREKLHETLSKARIGIQEGIAKTLPDDGRREMTASFVSRAIDAIYALQPNAELRNEGQAMLAEMTRFIKCTTEDQIVLAMHELTTITTGMLMRGMHPFGLYETVRRITAWAMLIPRIGESAVQPQTDKQARRAEEKAIASLEKTLNQLTDAGREEIWKPRCKTTVEWEESNRITTAAKRKKPTAPEAAMRTHGARGTIRNAAYMKRQKRMAIEICISTANHKTAPDSMFNPKIPLTIKKRKTTDSEVEQRNKHSRSHDLPPLGPQTQQDLADNANG